MAREKSCNLDKEEAEILKPSSPSPRSSSSPNPPAVVPPAMPPSPPLFHHPPQEPPIQRSQRPEAETSAAEPGGAASGGPVGKKPFRKEAEAEAPARSANRCSSCRRRVGLTGFRCRCGDLFCALHRYSDTHDCSFDYKAVGREAISKANPLIRAAKIIKI